MTDNEHLYCIVDHTRHDRSVMVSNCTIVQHDRMTALIRNKHHKK